LLALIMPRHDEDDTVRIVLEALPQRAQLRVGQLRRVRSAVDAGRAGLEAQVRPEAVADLARLQPRLPVGRDAGHELAAFRQRVTRLYRQHVVAVRDDEARVVDL